MQELCGNPTPDVTALAQHPEIINFYLENDLVSGSDSDYTNGIKVSWVSANLKDYIHDPCLPVWVRTLNRAFESVHPGQYSSRNMVVTAGQAMYTPSDKKATGIVANERPYAGWLYLGLGYNARNARQMDTVEVNLGMVGPASLAEQSQDFIHNLRGIERFNGWSNQLHNELGLQMVAERKNKIWISENKSGPKFDAISHYGVSLGNVATYANAGLELRAGSRLPDDFGTAPIRPASDSNAPLAEGAASRRLADHALHAFVALDARAVVRDIFLDGNTFGDSHSVAKKNLVGDASAGLAWHWPGGKLTYAYYMLSKEYQTQSKLHRYGSLTLSLEY
ncbi:MAG: lipid A deacylase LpxR family protein [Glaciimonas sp.]|nr:lipid A deacylase LpxR family protein [Glaciimonas sp.]